MRQRSNLIILFGIAFFIVGGAIVFLVLNDDDDGGGSNAGSTGTGQQASILVASADIAPNTLGADVIEQGLLEIRQVDAINQPSSALTSATALENQIFAIGVSEGDVITQAQLAPRSLTNIQVPEGYDGVSLQLDYTNGGAGYIAPGDTVNIYGVYGDATASDAGIGSGGPTPRTELALTNVLVLGVSAQEQTAAQAAAATEDPNANRNTSGAPLTYLLALRPADVERVVQLDQFADLYLSLTAADAPPTGDTPGSSGDNVNGPVSADSAAPRS